MMQKHSYYSTRDLLMMAALAALGGVSSTYINTLGDLFQSALGFAGTTQWAAGLHVLWLILAVGLTRKQGAGTITGILKGAVELLTGNTHGVLVFLVDITAGILVDIGTLPFLRQERMPGYAMAGGIAAASNVFVFQLFAALPADLLSYGGMFLIGLVAFASGVVFAGVLGFALLNSLRRSGVVKDQAPPPINMRASLGFLLLGVVMVMVLGLYLRRTLAGPTSVTIRGAVGHPYPFPSSEVDIGIEIRETEQNGISRRFEGYPLAAIIEFAEPLENARIVLIQASDGYGFFLSMEEIRTNPALLLAPHSDDDETSFDLVGPESSKAWVRNVTEMVLVQPEVLEIRGAVSAPGVFRPEEWQLEMDSATVDLSGGARKLQGVLLNSILDAMQPDAQAAHVVINSPNSSVALSLSDVLADHELRLFLVIEDDGISFALAHMNGDVIIENIHLIELE
ncbi:MAG: ECF transporter S component [Anaerolineales bacterium]|nr:ECF transporter S component [Anaerolineales bacterium]